MPLNPLNQQQRKQLTKANAAGGDTQANYLAAHPGVQKHITALQGGNANQQGRAASLLTRGTPGPGAAAPPPPTPAAPPPGNPAAGTGGGKAGAAAPTPAPTPPTTPAAPKTPATFDDALAGIYGSDVAKKFNLEGWTGDNPLETARTVADRGLKENLAQVRNRYAQSGGGSSGREALAEGQATGDFMAKFGDVAAERGIGARNTNLDRLSRMFTEGNQNDLMAQQLGNQMNQQLANLGTGTTAIGASEQEIPNLASFITALTNMSRTPTYSEGRQKQPSK